MSMPGTAAAAIPFRATARLTNRDVTEYIISALAKRGYRDVKVTYVYDSRSSEFDRSVTPSHKSAYKAAITGQKDGKLEEEKIHCDAVTSMVIAELEADGVAFDKSTVLISYNERERTVSASVLLLVPRKR